ncbi:hypothetical protein MBM_02224 [Drepanopeziza brunnea f. sp. 'multigermtubi' MB_m1]|uniref:Uncharacterized protein n=1 Tax=Marssonina brunnea f. sp. multigermtubi (strain MB_m1) TaxID=1072389 RepID=K1X1U5_MARBU|nr:uncharacterized protein MBM_02224 [Drepanopeziza brunnea f. sp. 'multigermtubi' MB_m1]EKD18987.1 hypothetical protein MBM_02224 [Drepanopeziza brunnea f. sp. 'multigermtubi' MB_m1]
MAPPRPLGSRPAQIVLPRNLMPSFNPQESLSPFATAPVVYPPPPAQAKCSPKPKKYQSAFANRPSPKTRSLTESPKRKRQVVQLSGPRRFFANLHPKRRVPAEGELEIWLAGQTKKISIEDHEVMSQATSPAETLENAHKSLKAVKRIRYWVKKQEVGSKGGFESVIKSEDMLSQRREEEDDGSEELIASLLTET